MNKVNEAMFQKGEIRLVSTLPDKRDQLYSLHTVKLESYDIEKGKHRIIKRLGVSNTEVEEGLTAEFNIQ
ncbi:hypothetical protein [Halobacillus trueperi]|uniref:Uncharacterized protein n=1 Tax=Halobacillus trueperi TaxID=156205 RepID=A0A3E0JBH7_9BACI|nr:hypothetical protein [Halobacillus trueperi]REJ10295.1 hypothetical protein DYE48_06215 [Halobacillus trueperi]